MRTKFLLFAFSFFAVSVAVVAPLTAQSRSNWPLEPAAASSNSRMVWGELDNGFRYAILPTEDSDEYSVSFRLIVGAGAGDEAKDKRGAARFVSHLAFNGATSQSADELFDMFTANGMRFYSSRRTTDGLYATSYNIDFDKADERSVSGTLDFLGDVAGRMSFNSDLIDREREYLKDQIVSGGLSQAAQDYDFDKLVYDGGVYSPVEGAALAQRVNSLASTDLEAYWKAYYQPNRMTLFVVGAFNAGALEKRIRDEFSGLKNADVAFPGRQAANSKKRSLSDIVAIRENTVLSKVSFARFEGEVDLFDAASEKRFWELELVGRYAQHVVDEGPRFDAGAVKPFHGGILLSTSMQGSLLMMETLVKNVDKGAHRMFAKGIEQAELNRLKAYYARLISERDLLLSERELPRLLADRFVLCCNENFPFRYGREFGSYLKAIHAKVDTAKVSELCAQFFNPKQSNLIIAIPDAIGLSSKAMTKRVKSMRKGYTFDWAVSMGKQSDWDIKQYFGQSGMVASTKTVELGTDFGLQYIFQNGMRVNVVRRSDVPGAFTARLSIGNGLSDMKSQFPGASSLIRELLLVSSMGDHKMAPLLYETLNGKSLDWVDTGVNQGQLFWQAEGDSPDELFAFLSLVTEWIITADIRKDDFDKVKERLTKATSSDMSTNSGNRDKALFGDDVRLQRNYDSETIEGLDHSAVNQWLIDLTNSGYLELTIVGDVEPRTVLRDVRKTLGSREKRTGLVDQPRHGTPATFPESGVQRLTSDGASKVARVSLYWPFPYQDGCEDLYRLNVIRKAFERHVIESAKGFKGDIYSIYVGDNWDWMIPGSGLIRVDLDCTGDSAAALESALKGCVDSFTGSLTEKRIRACESAVRVEFQNRFESRNQLVYLLDQSQAKPAIIKCVAAVASGDVGFELADYIALAKTVFAESNMRGVALTPGSK